MKNNTAQTCSSRPRQNRYTPGQVGDGTAGQNRGRQGRQVAVDIPLLGGQATAEVALDGGERQVDDSAVEEGDR